MTCKPQYNLDHGISWPGDETKELGMRYAWMIATTNANLLCVQTQLFAVGYGHTNAIQSVFVGDQFRQEQVRNTSLSENHNLRFLLWYATDKSVS